MKRGAAVAARKRTAEPRAKVRRARRKSEAPHRPRLLVAGSDTKRVAKVARRLEGLEARIEQYSWEEALEALRGSVAGLVLVLPIERVAMTASVEIVRDHPEAEKLLLFNIVPDGTSSRQARKLYGAGATVVLEWPREASILRSLFAESFGISRVRGRAKKADVALTRSVRARLRLFPELGAGRLRLFCRDGLLTITGQVRSLAQRQEIIDIIADVPGVRSVLAQTLRVQASRISDRTLKRRVETLLKNAAEMDDSTIAVSVRNGHISLTGTLSKQADLKRLEGMVTNLDGARGLETQLRIEPKRQSKDSQLTKRYRKALANLYPTERITLTVVDGVAILAGQVRALSTKRSITTLLERDPMIKRVVNKIEVQ